MRNGEIQKLNGSSIFRGYDERLNCNRERYSHKKRSQLAPLEYILYAIIWADISQKPSLLVLVAFVLLALA